MYPSFFNTLVMANLTRELGIQTDFFLANCALRIRVNISPIGSLILIFTPILLMTKFLLLRFKYYPYKNHQLALTIPGILPLIAISLSLHLPNPNFE